MNTIKLSNALSLPPDAATQTFLIVGKRGSGKSTYGPAQRAYNQRKKINKYGAAYADVDMRGKHGKQLRGASNGNWRGGAELARKRSSDELFQ